MSTSLTTLYQLAVIFGAGDLVQKVESTSTPIGFKCRLETNSAVLRTTYGFESKGKAKKEFAQALLARFPQWFPDPSGWLQPPPPELYVDHTKIDQLTFVRGDEEERATIYPCMSMIHWAQLLKTVRTTPNTKPMESQLWDILVKMWSYKAWGWAFTKVSDELAAKEYPKRAAEAILVVHNPLTLRFRIPTLQDPDVDYADHFYLVSDPDGNQITILTRFIPEWDPIPCNKGPQDAKYGLSIRPNFQDDRAPLKFRHRQGLKLGVFDICVKIRVDGDNMSESIKVRQLKRYGAGFLRGLVCSKHTIENLIVPELEFTRDNTDLDIYTDPSQETRDDDPSELKRAAVEDEIPIAIGDDYVSSKFFHASQTYNAKQALMEISQLGAFDLKKRHEASVYYLHIQNTQSLLDVRLREDFKTFIQPSPSRIINKHLSLDDIPPFCQALRHIVQFLCPNEFVISNPVRPEVVGTKKKSDESLAAQALAICHLRSLVMGRCAEIFRILNGDNPEEEFYQLLKASSAVRDDIPELRVSTRDVVWDFRNPLWNVKSKYTLKKRGAWEWLPYAEAAIFARAGHLLIYTESDLARDTLMNHLRLEPRPPGRPEDLYKELFYKAEIDGDYDDNIMKELELVLRHVIGNGIWASLYVLQGFTDEAWIASQNTKRESDEPKIKIQITDPTEEEPVPMTLTIRRPKTPPLKMFREDDLTNEVPTTAKFNVQSLIDDSLSSHEVDEHFEKIREQVTGAIKKEIEEIDGSSVFSNIQDSLGESDIDIAEPPIIKKTDHVINRMEERARMESDERARMESDERARMESDERARMESDERARMESDERARNERAVIESTESDRAATERAATEYYPLGSDLAGRKRARSLASQECRRPLRFYEKK